MINLGFLTGLGAAQKAASTSIDGNSTGHPAISIIAGILLALLIAVGLFILSKRKLRE
jgi:hypothetical protein